MSIRTEGYADDPIRMLGECLFVFTCCSIPQADGFVAAPTGEGVALWTEGYAGDIICMTYKINTYVTVIEA